MGNPFLLQACLRLKEENLPNPLILGKEYHFLKEGHRLYQINVPMDLRTTEWKFLGRIIVTEFTVGKNRTQGIFVLVKDFSDEDKEVITKTYVSDEEVKDIYKEGI
ncbi:DUF2584 family protein [Candidatus Woesearchaeota archaeon]|nr:DUF2584 family protein [Candidatus Woesearchaeota archaeon]